MVSSPGSTRRPDLRAHAANEVSDLVGFEVRNHRTGGGLPIRMRRLVTHTSSIRDNYDVYLPTYTVGDATQPLGDRLQDYLVPGGSLYSSRDSFHRWPVASGCTATSERPCPPTRSRKTDGG